MRPSVDGEADVLVALLGGGGKVVGASDVPPPVVVAPGRWRILAVLAGSLLALAGLMVLSAAWTGPLSGTLGFAVGLVAIAWGAARLSGTRLPGAGDYALRQAAVWSVAGVGAIAWCVLALALGSRLVRDGAPGGWPVAVGVLAVLAQAAGEEVFFRGWVQPALMRMMGPWWAVGLASVLFAGAHVMGAEVAPLSVVNIGLAGLWFGLLAWRSGGMAASIAAHWGWNAAEMAIFGLSPNPGYGPWGAWIGYDITGPALWGGGEEGLNASLLPALVIGAMVVVLLAPRRQLA